MITRKLSGWSEYKYYSCDIFSPKNIEELKLFLKKNYSKKKIITRGHGCSNGDQAVNANGIVVETNNLDKIISYNKINKTIEVESGVKLSDILMITMKDDLFFPCIPGGLDITVGGAISNNVHGKDCFKNGYFENNVSELKIISSNGDLTNVSSESNKELFESIFSSLGLIGIIYSVVLKLKEIDSPILEIDTKVAKNKNELKNFFYNVDEKNDYAIAWLDFSSKNKLRGIFSTAKFADKNKLSYTDKEKYKNKINNFLSKRKKNKIRELLFRIFWNFIGKVFGSKFFYFFNFVAFNIYRLLGSTKKNTIVPEFLLLHEKYLPEYNYLFKPKGFLTIQPFFNDKNPFDKIEEVVLLCQKFNLLPIWCPIKKYKKFNKKPLDFGGNGYSLVIEFSPYELGPEKTKKFVLELEKMIINQDGQIYLAKDHIVSKYSFQKMYPDHKKFLNLKNKYDKDNIFISEQFNRLFN